MTRVHYILIGFFGAASVLSIVTQNSDEFLVAYLGTIAAALCGLLIWGGVKVVRYTRSRLDTDMVVDRLKMGVFIFFFFVLPIVAIVALNDGEHRHRGFDADTQYDYLRR